MRDCGNCGGEGGFWVRNAETREWEYVVCNECKGRGERLYAVQPSESE